MAAVHEVMEVVRDFQDVPFLKGKKMSAASGKCLISAASADNSSGFCLLPCVDLALQVISVEQETCQYLLVLGWGVKGRCWRSPWHYRGEIPGAGHSGGTDTAELGQSWGWIPSASSRLGLGTTWRSGGGVGAAARALCTSYSLVCLQEEQTSLSGL